MSREDIAIILTFAIVIVLAVICGIGWHVIDHIKSKRPHESDDEEDNPITKFKDDLAEIYENYPNGKLKKLAQAVWNRVVQIEKWHDAEISDIERKYYSATCDAEELKEKCERYSNELDEWVARCKELKSKLEESEKCLNHSWEREANLRKANEGLHKLLKEEQEKNKIPLFSCETEVPSYLISENTFGNQINPFAKVVLNKEPLTATEATELAERLQNMTSKPIVLDSEDLNRYSTGRGPDGELLKDEPPIYNEEFNQKFRNIWFGVDNDTECHKYSVTVRKNGKEEKIIVLARSSIEAANLVPSGYTVEGMSRLFD